MACCLWIADEVDMMQSVFILYNNSSMQSRKQGWGKVFRKELNESVHVHFDKISPGVKFCQSAHEHSQIHLYGNQGHLDRCSRCIFYQVYSVVMKGRLYIFRYSSHLQQQAFYEQRQ